MVGDSRQRLDGSGPDIQRCRLAHGALALLARTPRWRGQGRDGPPGARRRTAGHATGNASRRRRRLFDVCIQVVAVYRQRHVDRMPARPPPTLEHRTRGAVPVALAARSGCRRPHGAARVSCWHPPDRGARRSAGLLRPGAGALAGAYGRWLHGQGMGARDRGLHRDRAIAKDSDRGDRLMTKAATADASTVLRQHAEQQFAAELTALTEADDRPRPPNWRLSPWAVRSYLLGGKLANGFEVQPKYIGNARLIEIAVATLATDRALLLIGLPGTAKSWVSEHLAAAISGDSRLLVQGTAGTDESALRYGWNYARLLAEGPSMAALVASPMLIAMRDGKLARVEELTRIPSDVQDTLITILSEKTLPVPELATEVQGTRGFNVIATANNRDKGVNELSSALLRRFNTVVLPLPATLDEEVDIVSRRVVELGRALALPAEKPALEEIKRVVTIFRELRDGLTADGKTKVKTPTGTLSTAEAISVVNGGLAYAGFYSDGVLRAADLAAGITGAIVKDPVQDKVVWLEYLKTVVKERDGWKDLYRACMEVVD